MKTYLRHRIWNVLDVKEILALEYLDFEGKYRHYTECHDFWELCYVEKGEIVLHTEENEQHLSEGELLLIAPEHTHSYVSLHGNDSRVFVACFACSSAALRPLADMCFLADDSQLAAMRIIIEESRNTFRMNEEEHIEVLDSPNFGGQQVILIQLEYLLIGLLRRLSTRHNAAVVFLSGEKFYADLVAVVIDYFRGHVRENLGLSDVCQKMNYSRSFLCKTFKEQTGETLMACFNRLKAEEAKRLLEETTWSITEISSHLGFSEVKYFGVLFKRYHKMSPSAYRRIRTSDKTESVTPTTATLSSQTNPKQ